MVNVLFVCTGNICRSPSAEAVFIKYVADKELQKVIQIDSAGTEGYHIGHPPDSRSLEVAKLRGYDLSILRAREVVIEDFLIYDYILAMTRSHYSYMIQMAHPDQHHRIRLFLEFAGNVTETDVPDPYYGGSRGFEHVLDLIENGCEGLLNHIIEHDLAAV